MGRTEIDDATGIEITPSDPINCKGNGKHYNDAGEPLECCCDECDYLIDCLEKEGIKPY